jgi:hypothetical protein
MKRADKSWMAVVAAAALLCTLVGVVWARPNDRPEATDSTRKVTLTGADFIPTTDSWDYVNYGGFVKCVSGECIFTAPVVFPCQVSVTVERITLHVNDANADEAAYADLYRANPSTGANTYWAEAKSPEGKSSGLQTYTSGAINKKVSPNQRAYIGLAITGNRIYVYGVTVEYHRNT